MIDVFAMLSLGVASVLMLIIGFWCFGWMITRGAGVREPFGATLGYGFLWAVIFATAGGVIMMFGRFVWRLLRQRRRQKGTK